MCTKTIKDMCFAPPESLKHINFTNGLLLPVSRRSRPGSLNLFRPSVRRAQEALGQDLLNVVAVAAQLRRSDLGDLRRPEAGCDPSSGADVGVPDC